MIARSFLAAALAAAIASSAYGQAVKPPPPLNTQMQPYNGQLRTDPAVGNVQGIQRYGRSLSTDPDEGEGFSYHVYPVTALSTGDASSGARLAASPAQAPAAPYPTPFNATSGLRNAYSESFVNVPFPLLTGAYAAVPVRKDGDVFHQPLIQVKVRVVEVNRSKALQVTSVLDFVRSKFVKTPNTLIMGNNINQDRRNLSGGTRFPSTSLISIMGGSLSGTGALVNLTTGNVNYIFELLENEFHADTITAPEVVTLNGQTVEFVSGQKVPFQLGQNVIQGNNNNIQQFFYKHVGSYISVTPAIVNWGKKTEGAGQAPLLSAEIHDWNQFIWKLKEKQDVVILGQDLKKQIADLAALLAQHKEILVPIALQEQIVSALNVYARSDLVRIGIIPPTADCPAADGASGCASKTGCDWRPQDCTIDLTVVMRLSATGTMTVGGAQMANAPSQTDVTMEDNVRAISDIVQVKSGHGVIMGGMIGESDVKDVSKVPILGDLPVVGALFRSKSVARQKTEVLLFIEAQVLDPCPPAAREQSAHDFLLGQPFVAGEFLDNPLEFGMYRAGFGAYLPPHSSEEKIFWERLGRRVRNMATTVDDILE